MKIRNTLCLVVFLVVIQDARGGYVLTGGGLTDNQYAFEQSGAGQGAIYDPYQNVNQTNVPINYASANSKSLFFGSLVQLGGTDAGSATVSPSISSVESLFFHLNSTDYAINSIPPNYASYGPSYGVENLITYSNLFTVNSPEIFNLNIAGTTGGSYGGNSNSYFSASTYFELDYYDSMGNLEPIVNFNYGDVPGSTTDIGGLVTLSKQITLTPARYRLIGQVTTNVGAISDASSASGDLAVTFVSAAVPEPPSLMLTGMGGLGTLLLTFLLQIQGMKRGRAGSRASRIGDGGNCGFAVSSKAA